MSKYTPITSVTSTTAEANQIMQLERWLISEAPEPSKREACQRTLRGLA
jgi:hypothetical protein